MNRKTLQEILRKHQLWLRDEDGGERADLSGTDLKGADLEHANLRGAILTHANLKNANLIGANLISANFTGANLEYAEVCDTNLSGAELRNANLNGVNLEFINLRNANLSGASGIMSQWEFIRDNFESTADGIIAYKTFGETYNPPERWEIEKGSVITENVDFDRSNSCSYGINVAPLEWVKIYHKGPIWKVLIRWEWLAGICVPYGSDGKIRCECAELLCIVGDDKEEINEKGTWNSYR